MINLTTSPTPVSPSPFESKSSKVLVASIAPSGSITVIVGSSSSTVSGSSEVSETLPVNPLESPVTFIEFEINGAEKAISSIIN